MDPAKLLIWKSKYGAIHVVPVEDQQVYYRGLTTLEFLALNDLQDSLPEEDWNEVVYKFAVLNQEELTFELVGSTTAIAELILNRSVFTEEEYQERVTKIRAWAKASTEQSVPFTLAIMAAKIYPGIDLIALLQMTPDQLLHIIAAIELAVQMPVLTSMDGPEVKPIHTSEDDLKRQGVDMHQISNTTNALRDEVLKHNELSHG